MKHSTIYNERMIAAMGETVFDILFQNDQPVAAVPGGSSFNSVISVGRIGLPCCFVGYAGNDRIGQRVVDFLNTNHVNSSCFEIRQGEKSALSLAFLDENGDANYTFYKEPPSSSEDCVLPTMKANDILLYGSYYAICSGMRKQVKQVLDDAESAGSIVYYDLNFRSSHRHELDALMPNIHSNMKQSTIVRGSADDFDVMFGLRDAQRIYEEQIRAYCPLFICTAGAGKVVVCTPNGCHEFQAPMVENVVSTVGAGDNFNAGFTCALMWEGIKKDQLLNLSKEKWQLIIETACSFAGEACQSTDNYVSLDFANRYARR